VKTYVITGATSGIAKELVSVFSRENGNIIYAGYRNENKLDKNVPENVRYFYIDLADEKSVEEAAKLIKSQVDKIDTLINAAGNVTAGPVEKIDISRLKEQFNINTFSHIKFTQELLEKMEGSKIINISSMAAFGNFPFISPYCASKRALDIFFNALALENHKNLKIVSIKPGVVSTPIWEKSVDTNWKFFAGCEEYAKELQFVKNNALKNTGRGLKTTDISKLVKKIDKMSNPKPSYSVGKDAKLTQILSLFPQKITNKIIKFGMKTRIKSGINIEN